jgi:hypothetical protein
MKKQYIWGVIALLVVAGGTFYGGMVYAQQSAAAARTAALAQYGGARFAGGARTAGGGVTAGQIIAKDATSITVQMQNGSTEIALIGSGTQVMKTTSGTLDDLSIGTNVAVTGTTNPDGSMTATAVQIRPAVQKAPAQ